MSPLVSFWSGKSVLVTGGAGFIGSHLTPALVASGAHVTVVDNLERGSKEAMRPVWAEISFHQVDLLDEEAANQVCSGQDIVLHLASKVGGIGYYTRKPFEVIEANLRMDGNVLGAVLTREVPLYFYASSAHVYPIELQGDAEAMPIREDQVLPAHPELSYGWAKLIGEKRIEYAMAEGRPIRASVARIIGAYGPNQDFDLATGSAIPVFIRRAIEYPHLAPFRVLGTGRETRSYCFVDDIVAGIMTSTEQLAGKPCVGPFNLGAEGRVSIGELARTIVDISGKEIAIEFDNRHPTLIWGQALDCSLAASLLRGWRPVVGLREGLQLCYRDIERRLAVSR
jgi:nucleoside-diphosphate-sugar epimerase